MTENEELALEVEDLTAALGSAYRERAHLVALLAAQYPSHIGHTDPSTPGWAVVTVELPTGQAAWHIAPGDMDLFGHVQPTPFYARGWDGHSTDEKYQRVDQLVRELHPEAPVAVAARPELRPDQISARELVEVIGKHPEWLDLPVHLLAMDDDAVWLNEIEQDCFDIDDGLVVSLIAHGTTRRTT